MSTGTTAIGIVLEIVGLIVAMVGINETWGEFAPSSERLAAPVLRRVEAARRGARATVLRVRDRLFRRKAPVVVITGTGHITVGGGQVRARGRVGYAPMPKDLPAAWFVAELDNRTRDLANRVADLRDRLEDETEALREAMSSQNAARQAADDRLDGFARRVATGGLRLQLVGLSVVALGLLFQLVALLLPA